MKRHVSGGGDASSPGFRRGLLGGLGRRAFLSDMGLGFTGLALGAMLHRDGLASDAAWSPPDGKPHSPPKAKNVIWLFMNGGVSHMESFDPKPEITKYAGKTISETPHADVQKNLGIERSIAMNAEQRNVLYPLQIGFKKHGQSGIEVSDWFPHTARNIDKIAVIRSMWTTDSNHGAQEQFHTGRNQLDGQFPTFGSWVHYGLGSLRDDLPQFISMGASRSWNRRQIQGNYLGPMHSAVEMRVDPANPLAFGRSARDLPQDVESLRLSLIQDLNRHTLVEYPDDAATAARIAAYELAFRMQQSVPEVMDFSGETEETKKLYGLDLPHCKEFAGQLLAARRLVERGVRFIQIQHGAESPAGGWDAHGGLKSNHEKNSLAVDQPIGALLEDLDRRGLLDETIVVFATEFGRTPGSQGSDGRDHHIFGFSVWMAGGGIKGGTVQGATDELGFHAVQDRHYVTDIHATVLKLLGLDSRKLEIPGRKRLAIDHGTPIDAIIG